MIDALKRLVQFALMAVLAVLVAFVSIQVVYRQLGIAGSFGWTEEAARGLFAWMVMLGAALGVAENTHFAIGSLVRKLPTRLQRAASGLKFTAIGTIALIFVVEGWQFTLRGLSRVSLVTGLPLIWTFASVFVAGVLMCIFLIANARAKTTGLELPELGL